MTELPEKELLYEKRVLGICVCGAPLYPVLNDDGERIGVTHETIEDDDYHFQFLASLRIGIIRDEDKK